MIADDGTEEDYDRLLMATGSTPFMLPIPGNDLPGVIGYRDIKDTDEMIDAAAKHKHAVVIGGGLLGLEAANGLKLRGMDVTVVHLGPWLLERQLDETAGKMLQKSLETRGLKFLLQTQTEALIQGESGRVAPSASRTACRFRPTWWLWPPASARTTRWPRAPALTATAACGERHHADLRPARSTPSANASATAASPTAWSRRCSSRPRSRPTTWPATASAATPAR